MEVYETECLVIGAGVVGLAVARQLAMLGKDVLLVERESAFGTQTSSRNSEVIHAGIYYPRDSLKARLCVRGKQLLYQYCQTRHVPHRRCGKLIVATNGNQLSELEAIAGRAGQNGVVDLEFLDKKTTMNTEPALNAVGALFSPSTGIVDSHAFMLQLLGDFESAGGTIVYHSPVELVDKVAEQMVFRLTNEEMIIRCRQCVNAAGLQAVELMQHSPVFPDHSVPQFHRAKGNYFAYSGRAPFSHLIYPVPEVGGLGIHLTLDMGGGARFGPDVQWLDPGEDIDYTVEPELKDKFAQAISSYWPEVEPDRLIPDYSGVRPKLSGRGQAAADFVIQGVDSHSIDGLINLFGIESPGLTASLALAEEVAGQLKG